MNPMCWYDVPYNKITWYSSFFPFLPAEPFDTGEAEKELEHPGGGSPLPLAAWECKETRQTRWGSIHWPVLFEERTTKATSWGAPKDSLLLPWSFIVLHPNPIASFRILVLCLPWAVFFRPLAKMGDVNETEAGKNMKHGWCFPFLQPQLDNHLPINLPQLQL